MDYDNPIFSGFSDYFTVEEHEGFRWAIRPNSISGRDGQIKDTVGFSKNEMPQMEFLKSRADPGGVFVDVGAHVGKYSIQLSPHYGEVVAIEPNIWHFLNLVRNIDLNRALSISALNLAAWAYPCTLTMGMAPESTQISEGNRPTISVALDDIISVCSAMKIDVEGFELDVLYGADSILRKHKPVLSIDTHEHTYGIGGQYDEIVSLLKTYNYTIENAYKTLKGDWNIVAY